MSLRKTAISASRWTAISAVIRTALQLLQTVALARLLHPSDFGLMALVGAMLAIATLFSDFGVSRALIHFEHVSERAKGSLFCFNVTLGALLSISFAMLAPVMALIYRQPALTPLLFAVSPMFFVLSLGQQLNVLAEKSLNFETLAFNEIVATTFGLVIAIAVAVGGGGVYSLVLGALATATAGSLLAWLRLSHGNVPRRVWDLREVTPFLRYGGYLTAENVANTLLRQSDLFVGGLVATPLALGTYSLPRDLSMKLSLVVNPVITRIGFPVMARLQSDKKALAEVYRQTLIMTASINFPAYVALGLFAQDIISVLYGSQWSGAVPYLQLLAAWGAVRSIINPTGSLLYATGRARRALWWNLVMLAVVPPLLWLAASHYGLQGLAWTLLIIQVLQLAPSWHYLVKPSCGLSLMANFLAISAPMLGAFGAGVLAYFALDHLHESLLRLTVGGIVFGLGYLALSFLINRTWVRTVLELLHIKHS
ncbi:MULTISPECIES: MOP flippase family protein [Dyella]|uniref:MOP flippase family protein n=2 Tax=Dyella TaxID=231454 RepID=A0A4R0YSG5_9GAMM|nr:MULTISPECIES: MOP flippase family protein [Dyella]TBR40141.1 MOP flippase family protein [Dyella terrae]TCI12275.1 MOP flippase family protein [Dyella soli]